MDLAAEDALESVCEYLTEQGQPTRVRFVLFDPGAYGAFARVLEEMSR